MQSAPLPDPGPCAEPPAGIYEYGEIGIGTCLAAPTDLELLDGDRYLAVSNANIWEDFTGGSLSVIDLDTVDWTAGRNVLAPRGSTDGVVTAAVDLPTFNGEMALASPRDTLIVTNRLSDGRTRESDDAVWFVDVADAADPKLAELGPDGAWLDVGWDPVAVHYDEGTDMAYVVNRTAHAVAMVDMGADPVELVPPGGPARLEPGTFVDVDGSGSQAGFVELDFIEDTEDVLPGALSWDLEWASGTVRVWVPSTDGAFRMTGNAEGLWERSNVPEDLDLEDSDDVVEAIHDPSLSFEETDSYGAMARMVFEDQGVIRAAFTYATLEDWYFEEEALLQARESAWDAELSGPNLVVDGDTWYLFYGGTDGETTAIGLATSADGADFSRDDDEPVLAVDGAALADPFVLWDEQEGRWRMWFTVDGAGIGQAVSDDLVSWTVRGETWAPTGGATAPAVAVWDGLFHLMYVDSAGALLESTSLDGTAWSDGVAPFALDVDADVSGGVALQSSPEEGFTLTEQGGDVFAFTLYPGETVVSYAGGWQVRVAVGQVLDPQVLEASSLQLDSVVGDLAFVTVTDSFGEATIHAATRSGNDLVLDAEPALDVRAGGDWDADGVSSAVVFEAAGGYEMYYAGTAGDVTSIGHATSSDGRVWTADPDPVLESSADWESVALTPGSVQQLDDGSLRLWYTAWDGDNSRIALAESTDGGASFTRVPGAEYDWIFDAGAPGVWYDSGVAAPFVVRDGDTERMWFAGDSGEAWQIGYAEREVGDDVWTPATDEDGSDRPVLAAALGGFGIDGVTRPVVLADGEAWELWYTGLDDDADALPTGRIGRAEGADPDRFHRDLRLPDSGDTWSFTNVPANEGDTISLDQVVDDLYLTALGCSAIASDETRGMLYVGCKLVPYVFIVDVRDDSTDDFEDLNYLDLEGILEVDTTSSSSEGMRALLVDPERGWLWGLSDDPEAVYALDLTNVVDDADTEIVEEPILAMLPLPRGALGDQGVETKMSIGPGQLAMHPDGHTLFVTNFNDNSLSAYDLSIGAVGTLIGQTEEIGENPYALTISSDGSFAAVANFSGEVVDNVTSGTIALLDADPTSPTFLQVKTWLVNQ